jgi:hypothetical protein
MIYLCFIESFEILKTQHNLYWAFLISKAFMISCFKKKNKKKIPLLYVWEGSAIGAFQIFNLPQLIGLKGLKSRRAP